MLCEKPEKVEGSRSENMSSGTAHSAMAGFGPHRCSAGYSLVLSPVSSGARYGGWLFSLSVIFHTVTVINQVGED